MKRVLVLCPRVPGRAAIIDAIKEGQLSGARFPADLEFEFRVCRFSAPVWDNYRDFALSDFATVEAGIDAEREGFDAVCIETITDGGLEALRSVLRIPVLGAGQCAYQTALLLGARFSIIVVWEGFRLAHERSLRLHGLSDRCASIRDIGMRPDEVNFANMFGSREQEYYDRLAEVAMRAIEEDGAHCIVLGSTTMYKARPHLAGRLPVPVIDPATALYKQAQALLELGLTHSRAAYPHATVAKDDEIHRMAGAVDESDQP
jgi:Asp/Glu/hydantoin racemase